MSPRKIRAISDLIRGMDADNAKKQLQFLSKRGAPSVAKLLDSAISNAKNNFSKSEGNLYIKKISVDNGPAHKRFRPTGRGHAAPIKRRTSHVTIVLDERSSEIKQEKTENKKEKKVSA